MSRTPRWLTILAFVVTILVLWWAMIHVRPAIRAVGSALLSYWPWLLLSAAIVGVIALFARRLLIAAYRAVNGVIPWYRLPPFLGALNLDAYRFVLRDKNLHDVPPPDLAPAEFHPKVVSARTPDGSFNDLEEPDMGRANARFGRNFPLPMIVRKDKQRMVEHPTPREVSRTLMTRDFFKPAESLNMLAAAWIQFMVHGWINHKRMPDEFHEVPLQEGDPWPENPMRIAKTREDSPETKDFPATYSNSESHWWDGSQIYGSKLSRQMGLRSQADGKFLVDLHPGLQEYRLPENPSEKLPGIDRTGFFDNYWMGLSLFHTIFVLEHNAICDALKVEYPTWGDQQLFDTARLVNCALMAKIHTVEWTPGILAHPTLRVSMNANWWGLFGERIHRALGRLSDREEISGILGSPADHHSASYSLTEEFTSVYRLHALIPDDYEFFSARTGESLGKKTFPEIEGSNTRPSMNDMSLADMIYSFGIAHPGAITLHNFPKALQNLRRLDDQVLDLASIDILRDRERGVPRYNEFRRLCHMRPVKSFRQLCANEVWAKQIEELYHGEIEDVDLMVGLYAESPPPGFGFSDTAFRIFILMASRRLKSDRFFTDDYRPEFYTQMGLNWINENSMASVFMRHVPDVAPALHGVKNAFAPWTQVTETRPIGTPNH